MENSLTSLPFGDGLATAPGGTDTDANHFATLDHDHESVAEHAQLRQYSSAQGLARARPIQSAEFKRFANASNNP